jgi:hypothetical protein
LEQFLIKANRLLHIAAIISRVGIPQERFGSPGLAGGSKRDDSQQTKQAGAQRARCQCQPQRTSPPRQNPHNAPGFDRHSSARIAEYEVAGQAIAQALRGGKIDCTQPSSVEPTGRTNIGFRAGHLEPLVHIVALP